MPNRDITFYYYTQTLYFALNTNALQNYKNKKPCHFFLLTGVLQHISK
ncbi:MAG: hypothetical protein ACI9TY_001805 [Alphaproteobacteria bacterium]|jgi:hypothetical protein